MKYGLFYQLDNLGEESADSECQPLPPHRGSKRRKSSSAVYNNSAWKQYARRSLGTPFPASLPVSPQPANDRLYELVQKATVTVLSTDATHSARSDACIKYARPIQYELAETQAFLSKLSISASNKPAKPDLISSITDTLNKVEQMRTEFKQHKKAKEQAEAAAAAKQKAEAEVEAKAKAKAKAAAAAATDAKQPEPSKPLPSAATPSAIKPPSEHGLKYREMYAKMMSDLAPRIKANREHKSFCFKQRGLITRGVGQLKDSWEFIIRTADNIKATLAEAQSPDVHQWMLNLVAKTMVKQAEREVSVAYHAAYPLAATAVLVMQQYPQLIDMLMIRWVKKCPFVIPEYVAKSPGQSTDDYLKMAGYKRNEDDELESESIYSERMAGMLALFAAIVQTPDIGDKPNPFPIYHGWVWLARMINMPPQAISPMLVQTFLSIAGNAMLNAYGSQMHKLLQAIHVQWLPKLTDTSPLAKAGKSNLTTFLEEYMQSGKLRECNGRNVKTR
ncbi:hypothetical protein LPJ55_005063 [Coemansia sp. RSA 990]|nr:hypothetical protein LPJ55_005063 [Coemansia sp. RSA 990]